jgi:hypothetical protein
MNDPFETLGFRKEPNPENWTETDRLHTPTLDAVLTGGRLLLLFQGRDVKHLSRSDVEALTRFLVQYANVKPLPEPEGPFEEGWTPTRVIGSDGPEYE